MRFTSLAVLAVPAALALAPAAATQQRIGILLSTVSSTSPGNACGFDCNDPSNTRVIPVQNGQTVSVHLFGDAGLPAALVIGFGPALPICPAVPIPGIQNSLLIAPNNILVALPAPPPQTVGRTICPSAGSTTALAQLPVPASAAGATLTWQGFAYDQGTPSFTRAIETPIR